MIENNNLLKKLKFIEVVAIMTVLDPSFLKNRYGTLNLISVVEN